MRPLWNNIAVHYASLSPTTLMLLPPLVRRAPLIVVTTLRLTLAVAILGPSGRSMVSSTLIFRLMKVPVEERRL